MILDYIDNLSISDEDAKEHDYACQTLARLAEGLFWINQEVIHTESAVRAKAEPRDVQISAAGDLLSVESLGFMSSVFQWYVVSICNYVQLTGWLAYRNPRKAKEYLDRVLPNLSHYRNKVAAHFALADPRKDDNESSLIASVITNVVYAKGHLYAGALFPEKIRGKKLGESSIRSWSVTIAHKKLVQRYWPQGKPKSHSAIMVPAYSSLIMKIEYDSPL